MLNFWKKKNTESTPQRDGLTWSDAARAGLEQALAQAPVPALLKNRVRGELKSAAEATAQAAGRSEVTPQDLMEGMLSKMPAAMRNQVETAMKGGPEALNDLQKRLQKK